MSRLLLLYQAPPLAWMFPTCSCWCERVGPDNLLESSEPPDPWRRSGRGGEGGGGQGEEERCGRFRKPRTVVSLRLDRLKVSAALSESSRSDSLP